MNKTATKKRKDIGKIKSKLSDIVKYLEQAGMVGAKELRSAMNAIDGSFVDDCIVDGIMSDTPDVQRALPGSMPYALHGGFGGRPSLFDGQSATVAWAVNELVSMADKLDQSGKYDEASEIDEILKDMMSPEDLDIVEHLEEVEDKKDKQIVDEPEDEEKEGTDVMVQSNGLVPTEFSQHSGFSGLSDSYFYTSYRNLEAPYK